MWVWHEPGQGMPEYSWLPVCVHGDGGGGQCGWKAPGQSPRQDGGLHVPHSSQQLGHYGCLEKEAGDTAVDWCPYTTSGYCRQASVPFGRGGERAEEQGGDQDGRPFTGHQAL